MSSRVTPRPTDRYLGDSVYLQTGDYAGAFWLYTYNGVWVQESIYFEPEVLDALLAVVRPERDEPEDNLTDAEADADTLASAGHGTDEDYGG